MVWWDVVKEAFGFVVVFVSQSFLLLHTLAVLGLPRVHLFICSNSQKDIHTHAHPLKLRSIVSHWNWIDRYPLNTPAISFVISSLNCAFAVSKSKSDSNCKVVALEFFRRSWPLLLFLDLRLPACEYWKKFRCVGQNKKQKQTHTHKKTLLWDWFTDHLEQAHLLSNIYLEKIPAVLLTSLFLDIRNSQDKTNIAIFVSKKQISVCIFFFYSNTLFLLLFLVPSALALNLACTRLRWCPA